ncbi:MAG: hypothetical protein IJ563_03825 [Selenomonadaceae bacterium]|nr:hypothetical protein [Selenomonadaceae bacterium]
MLKKLIFVVLAILMMTTVAFAADESDTELLNDMYNNPKNYISLGGAGSGIAIYISKSSVNVQQYSPPKYIIAVQWISVSFTRRQENGIWKDVVYADLGRNERYLYDYESKKIYAEDYDNENNPYWEYLDTKNINDPGTAGRAKSMKMASAELAFYWAYNMSFFDKPISWRFKRYMEEGKGTFDDQ